jgi:hypothetical protein
MQQVYPEGRDGGQAAMSITRSIRSFFVGLALGLMYGCSAIGMNDRGFFIYPDQGTIIGHTLWWIQDDAEIIAQYATVAIPELSVYNARRLNDHTHTVPA